VESIIDIFLKENLQIAITIFTVITAMFTFEVFKRRSKLFYSEDSTTEYDDRVRIKKLEKELSNLRKDISSGLLQNASELIDKEVSQYLNENIEEMTAKKLTETNALESEIFKELESKVLERIDLFLDSKSDSDFAATKKENDLISRRTYTEKELNQTVEQERKSAGLLKSVMINLFVIVNFGLIGLYVFKGAELSQYGALSLSGLYVSLAGFIIYIFRASNARTSVLLAIKEDLKKQNTAMEYVESIGNSRTLSQNDIDLIRMLMTNHSEREKKVDHPYEMVFKGISGSNIQFKGGKMAIGEK
jgi:hypothetical protein